MTDSQVVPEIDVLVASALWLYRRSVLPHTFSVARGAGIDAKESQDRIVRSLRAAGMPEVAVKYLRFASDGPDLVGVSGSEYWKIECKGAGTGKAQTQRNNFDRALASVVSYYEDVAERAEIPPGGQLALGLALPATGAYLGELRRRVRAALRSRLNLWILLYDPASRALRPISPGQDYEHEG